MRNKNRELTRDVLVMLAAGVLLTAAFAAPNVIQLAKPLLARYKNVEKYELRRKREALKRLRQRKLVELVEKGNETWIRITKDGKEYIGKYEIDNVTLKKDVRWDGNWRIVMFDIPEAKRKARQALCYQFQRLGLYPVQKSVFAYPFECEKEIDFVIVFFDVTRYVTYFVAKDLGNAEGRAREYFNLL